MVKASLKTPVTFSEIALSWFLCIFFQHTKSTKYTRKCCGSSCDGDCDVSVFGHFKFDVKAAWMWAVVLLLQPKLSSVFQFWPSSCVFLALANLIAINWFWFCRPNDNPPWGNIVHVRHHLQGSVISHRFPPGCYVRFKFNLWCSANKIVWYPRFKISGREVIALSYGHTAISQIPAGILEASVRWCVLLSFGEPRYVCFHLQDHGCVDGQPVMVDKDPLVWMILPPPVRQPDIH